MKLTERLKTGMLLRHYKGQVYRVLHESTHTETGEVLVNYFASPNKELMIKQWARPKHMFDDLVEHQGVQVPRFTIVEN